MMFTMIGDIVNYAGFQYVLGISYELDSITELDKKSTYVFGVEGYVFENTEEFGNRLTFSQTRLGGQLPFNPKLLTDRAFHARHSNYVTQYATLISPLFIADWPSKGSVMLSMLMTKVRDGMTFEKI
jgi:hypothetical protein